MQAVIMAGGKGTRLAALTKDEIPKPIVPVAGKPLLLWQVERLKEKGITDLIMVIGHLGEKIQEYFGDGSQCGVHIEYFVELYHTLKVNIKQKVSGHHQECVLFQHLF